ncbi:YheC/YheD family protein [Cytobacillus suaedae]|nr:YheC/YheD family protein [Cytobacillus suaedae]
MSENGTGYSRRPIVGILVPSTRRFIKQRLKRRHILTKASENINSTLYFFSLKDVNLVTKRINGYSLNKVSGLWIQKEYPYPDVFYNRSVNMEKKKYKPLIESFKNDNVIFLNPVGRFNKWKVHKLLSENHKIKRYLPHTVKFSKKNLTTMINKYEKVYVKGNVSGLGKHVIQIVKTPTREYQLQYFRKKLTTYTTSSFKEVIKKLKELLNGKKAIIQEMIESSDPALNMRVDAQRNKHKKVEIIGLSIRVSTRKSPISNTKTKPLFYVLDDYFSNHLGYSIDNLNNLNQEIVELINEVYLTLEREYGSFVEMGIDIIFDKDYNMYFIESNATPGRTSLFNAYDYKTYVKAVTNVFEYTQSIYSDKN